MSLSDEFHQDNHPKIAPIAATASTAAACHGRSIKRHHDHSACTLTAAKQALTLMQSSSDLTVQSVLHSFGKTPVPSVKAAAPLVLFGASASHHCSDWQHCPTLS